MVGTHAKVNPKNPREMRIYMQGFKDGNEMAEIIHKWSDEKSAEESLKWVIKELIARERQ